MIFVYRENVVLFMNSGAFFCIGKNLRVKKDVQDQKPLGTDPRDKPILPLDFIK